MSGLYLSLKPVPPPMFLLSYGFPSEQLTETRNLIVIFSYLPIIYPEVSSFMK